MADVVEDFVNEITAAQESIAEKREEVGAALVEHMLKLPGMEQIFDTDQDKQMFGTQITNMIEMAARTKAVILPPPPEPVPIPSMEGNGGEPPA